MLPGFLCLSRCFAGRIDGRLRLYDVFFIHIKRWGMRMAEMVYRRRRHKKIRMLDERRFAIPTPSVTQMRAAAVAATQALPGFLLALADLLRMPSGLHVAYVAGLAALERPIRWPVAGAVLAMMLRLISGLDPRWEGIISLGILMTGPLLLRGCGNGRLSAFTAVAMLPLAVRGWLAPTLLEMVRCLASAGLSVVSATLLCRGVKALTAQTADGRAIHINAMEDRLCTAVLASCMIAGGARLLAIGVNVGMLMAGVAVLLLAIHFGAGAGCTAGIAAGMALALAGLPLMLSVALAAGGCLAGVMQASGRRWMCCWVFAGAALIPMYMAGAAGMGCSMATLAAALIVLLMPEKVSRRVAGFVNRFRNDEPSAGNAYAASMLSAWERTVGEMARAVPVPDAGEEHRDGGWWTEKLCSGCAAEEACPGLRSPYAIGCVEEVWSRRHAEDGVWRGALEGLRGLGCQRLYHLWQEMDTLRLEELTRQRKICHLTEQREMLVTHLTALSGAARRFAQLSQGENWWDAMMARRIRRILSDEATPARLMWVRKVHDHVQAAFELTDIISPQRQALDLCHVVEAALGAPMTPTQIEGERVYLSEIPPLEVICGLAMDCADGEHVSGDTVWQGRLQDGRFMAAVADGMGHGEAAAIASGQTAELLRLCLDAGYSMQQTVKAVNGMMLMGSCGERFTTVDLLTVDLWTGQAMLKKLGAACSWLQQKDELTLMTGDALPIGILESVQSGEQVVRLAVGDTLVLMTDGVEEAFADRALLREAVLQALQEDEIARAAENLLFAARIAAGDRADDDQTVLVLRICAAAHGETV